ncbi:MAG: hypothetical protein IPQ09_19995 [Myxococcales bacterium]|nr:hypothetical protein [Myxococcales bacterium]
MHSTTTTSDSPEVRGRRRGVALAPVLATALAAVLAAGVGCKRRPPAAGDACVGAQIECTSPSRALLCEGSGRFRESPCRGPKGCEGGAAPACDVSIGKAGDPCEVVPGRPPRAACTEDGRTALVCRDGALAPTFDCTKLDCHLDGAQPACGAMTAVAGYVCGVEGGAVCGEDQRSILRCVSGRFVRYLGCHGKLGCTGAVDPPCDDTVAAVGDPCAQSGFVVCSEDGRAELICKNGRFTESRACPRSGCEVTDIARKRIECH